MTEAPVPDLDLAEVERLLEAGRFAPENVHGRLRLLEAHCRSLLSALKAERERAGKMEAALERLIADYSDVPDATDTEAQQAFADARAALGGRT